MAASICTRSEPATTYRAGPCRRLARTITLHGANAEGLISKGLLFSRFPVASLVTKSSGKNTDGFILKRPSFGKFEVRHKQGKMRKIPLTGKTQMTADKRKVKFIPLARLRELENRPE